MSTRRSRLAALLALLVMAALFWVFSPVIRHQDAEVEQLRHSLEGLGNELRDRVEIASDLPKFRKKLEALQQRLDGQYRLVPRTPDTEPYRKSLEQLAHTSGLMGVVFSAGTPIEQASCFEIPIALRVEGSPEALAEFLRGIASAGRLVRLDKVSMTRPEFREEEVVMKASLDLSVFAFSAQEQE